MLIGEEIWSHFVHPDTSPYSILAMPLSNIQAGVAQVRAVKSDSFDMTDRKIAEYLKRAAGQFAAAEIDAAFRQD